MFQLSVQTIIRIRYIIIIFCAGKCDNSGIIDVARSFYQLKQNKRTDHVIHLSIVLFPILYVLWYDTTGRLVWKMKSQYLVHKTVYQMYHIVLGMPATLY